MAGFALALMTAAPCTAEGEAETLRLITDGKGSLILNGDGTVECAAAEGYETVSITADKRAGDTAPGDQIPELEVSDIRFEEGTTITAVFQKPGTDEPVLKTPASAAAVF